MSKKLCYWLHYVTLIELCYGNRIAFYYSSKSLLYYINRILLHYQIAFVALMDFWYITKICYIIGSTFCCQNSVTLHCITLME